LEAVIHPNEPEQIIFLAKRAYDVLETFKLPPRGETDGEAMPSKEDEGRLIQKAAGLVAEALNDRISGLAWKRGFCPFSNLSMLRNWLATEKIEKVPAEPNDPTVALSRPKTSYRVDGWVTAKGRLIVVTPATMGTDSVHDTSVWDASSEAMDKMRVRPGELEDVIKDNLSNQQENLDKPHHRSRLDYNALSIDVSVVGEWSTPITVSTDVHESLDDLTKHIKVAIGNASAKSPFKRITPPLLAQYERTLRKNQVQPPTSPNYIGNLIKPTEDPAEDASSGEPPSATPAAPDDSAEHPAP
jgi:hypothetical protein